MQLSARCDFRIATAKSTFGMPEPLRSLVPINLMDTMELGFVPLGNALWIILSGEHFSAQEAHRIGFVQWIVPDRDAMMAEAEKRAEILKLCAPLAVKALKNGVHLHMNPPTPPTGVTLLEHLREVNGPWYKRSTRARTAWRARRPSPRSARRTGRAAKTKGTYPICRPPGGNPLTSQLAAVWCTARTYPLPIIRCQGSVVSCTLCSRADVSH